jgi:hypothetical protein
MASFRGLSCRIGKSLVCYCLPHVLADIPFYNDKIQLLKAIFQHRTMLIRVDIGPSTDIDALVAYWGKAFWATDVRAILESLKRLPAGGQLDIMELLPPLPSALLYTYPLPPNRMNESIVRQNCSWTALNFFRDSPDPRFSDPKIVQEVLKSDYYSVQADPRYGDVIVLLSPAGYLLHTAIYIADDIVFTKNGDDLLQPWVFSPLSDLIDEFSMGLPPGKSPSVLYFRNKNY